MRGLEEISEKSAFSFMLILHTVNLGKSVVQFNFFALLVGNLKFGNAERGIFHNPDPFIVFEIPLHLPGNKPFRVVRVQERVHVQRNAFLVLPRQQVVYNAVDLVGYQDTG